MSEQMEHELYGLLAEFDDEAALVAAARAARAEGYTAMDAFSPYPIEELDEALAVRPTRLPWVVLVAGLCGAAGGYFLQYYAAVIDYPWNVGGRPAHSWPMFIPITFECAILAAGLTAVIAMLARNGLPRPNHPLFAAMQFERASQDKLFLCIEAKDPKFDPQKTRGWLEHHAGREVTDVWV